jgi:hypothetical protein
MAKTPASSPRRRSKPAVPAGAQPFIAEPAAAAAHGETLSSDMDYAAHEAMYMRFTSLVKWGIVAVAILVIFLFVVIHPMVPPPAS